MQVSRKGCKACLKDRVFLTFLDKIIGTNSSHTRLQDAAREPKFVKIRANLNCHGLESESEMETTDAAALVGDSRSPRIPPTTWPVFGFFG